MNGTERYWITVVSKDHIKRGVEGGFMQANHGKAGPLKKLHVNDWVIFYSPKVTYQGDEKHEVAGQGEKQHHAVAAEEISGSTTARGPVVPIFAVAATTSRPAGYRRLAAKSRVLALGLNGGAGEGSGHGRNSDILKITPVSASGPNGI